MNKETAINRAYQSLTIQIEALRLMELDDEDRDALGDDSQWPAMLDDMESRVGMDVSEARELLSLHADIGALEDAMNDADEAVNIANGRDAFAIAYGEYETARDAFNAMRSALARVQPA